MRLLLLVTLSLSHGSVYWPFEGFTGGNLSRKWLEVFKKRSNRSRHRDLEVLRYWHGIWWLHPQEALHASIPRCGLLVSCSLPPAQRWITDMWLASWSGSRKRALRREMRWRLRILGRESRHHRLMDRMSLRLQRRWSHQVWLWRRGLGISRWWFAEWEEGVMGYEIRYD